MVRLDDGDRRPAALNAIVEVALARAGAVYSRRRKGSIGATLAEKDR